MASARKYAVICNGNRVVSGLPYGQALKVFDAMTLAFVECRKYCEEKGVEPCIPPAVLCVDI